MCVIAVYHTLPELSELEKMQLTNSNGCGIAYKHNNFIYYEKGITIKKMHNIIKKGYFPYIVHFRLATVGKVNTYFCQPFVISKNCETNHKGKSKTVFFHNGHFAHWEKILINLMIVKNLKINRNKINDSKLLSLLAYYNRNCLDFIQDQKMVIFDTKNIKYYGEFTKKNGNIYSNMNWNYPIHTNYKNENEYYERYYNKLHFFKKECIKEDLL